MLNPYEKISAQTVKIIGEYASKAGRLQGVNDILVYALGSAIKLAEGKIATSDELKELKEILSKCDRESYKVIDG